MSVCKVTVNMGSLMGFVITILFSFVPNGKHSASC